MDRVVLTETSTRPKTTPSSFRAVPEENSAPMPVQDLTRWDATSQTCQAPRQPIAWRRRAIIFLSTLAITGVASYEMYGVLSVVGMTTLQVALLVIFAFNFLWIALPFVSGLAGFFVLLRNRGVSAMTLPVSSPLASLRTRTALLMPIYNETPPRLYASLQTIYESLEGLGAIDSFDLFILSDTTEPDIWLEEEVGFWQLRRRTGGEKRIFYRHRAKNSRRKAGNIADFCQRWGSQYDHMIILDADSIMTGDSLVRLAASMEANPQAGLIQTLPLVVNRHTLFARTQQFAARIYGPIIAAGIAYWHIGDSSYWGHNAIIRTRVFMEHAGLPDFPGRAPFGGHILSHDFVEAALIRRAGWQIYLAPEIIGSYEESPPSLIDFSTRDRRWCQGNLQHIKLLRAKGLHWMSRLHLLMGVIAYLASPFWLIFIVLGLLLALQAHFIQLEYFTEKVALFPTWPVFDPERSMRLFMFTMAILLAPKVLSYLLLCKDRQLASRFGGRLRTGASVLFETFLSALIAPVMMVFQSAVVVGILTGRDVGWDAQRRDDGSIPLRSVVRCHLMHTLFGVVLAVAAYMVSPPLLAWLSPVVLGLLLAIPVSAVTGWQELGHIVRRLGLLVTPEESEAPDVVRRANELELAYEFSIKCPDGIDVLERLAGDPDLRALHAAMLPLKHERRKGEFDADLLLGLAKLEDAETIAEASAMLSSREKLVVLGHRDGITRLGQLTSVEGTGRK